MVRDGMRVCKVTRAPERCQCRAPPQSHTSPRRRFDTCADRVLRSVKVTRTFCRGCFADGMMHVVWVSRASDATQS